MDGYPTIQEILDNFIQYIENNSPVSASELPNIDLYMDQVTTFMDKYLEHSKRYRKIRFSLKR